MDDPGAPHGLSTTLVIGMEVHVELATRSKMWTSAPNLAHPDHFDAEPNTLLSPVVVGLPGTLPVINAAAVDLSLRVGLAMECEIPDRCKWDRKSYGYPDLPKNYQISQYDQPLCGPGALAVTRDDGSSFTVQITRAHLEEDAGKLLHELPGGGSSEGSLVDLNRAGTPLLEIVTEPDLRSADDAVRFCQTLRELVRHLRVSHAIMQRGQIRFEPNINVVITDAQGRAFKTPIVEVKNLNSYNAVHGAIEYEHGRQVEAWLEDGRVMGAGSKATRGWDDGAHVTTLQREKEDAHDYRYFPDPDLVVVEVSSEQLERLRRSQPPLPSHRRVRYAEQLGLKPADVESLMAEPRVADLMDEAAADAKPAFAQRVAGVLLNPMSKLANERGVAVPDLGIDAGSLNELVRLLEADRLNNRGVASLLVLLADRSADRKAQDQERPSVAALAEEHQLLQVDDESAVDAWVQTVLEDPKNTKALDDLRAGKQKAVGALVGQVMKLSGGQANPKTLTPKILARVAAEPDA